eukprot:COSAG06_NODE_15827_length_1042_cov_0.848356_2_plen_26_part_01
MARHDTTRHDVGMIVAEQAIYVACLM